MAILSKKKHFFFFFEMFQQISICYKKCNKCKICYIILNVLVLKMKTMFPQNQIHGIVLTALSFPKLFKKISIYKIMFLLQISKAFQIDLILFHCWYLIYTKHDHFIEKASFHEMLFQKILQAIVNLSS